VPRAQQRNASNMPALLPLAQLDETLKTRLAEHMSEADLGRVMNIPSCLIRAPSVAPERMAAYLTRRLMLHAPQYKIFLRFYDSRVFIQLGRILNLLQIRAMYDGIQAWAVSIDDRWLCLPAPEAGPMYHFWSINTEQTRRVMRTIHFNGALAEARNQRDAPWKDLAEYLAAAETAERAVTTAIDVYLLSMVEDIAAFAAHAILYGEHFHLHPLIQKCMQDVKENGNTGYTYAIALLEDSGWAAIAGR
jgi:hypothetical protein